MIVKPLAERRHPKPLALVSCGSPARLTIVTEHGEHSTYVGKRKCAEGLRRLEGWIVYSATPLRQTILSAGADNFTGWVWKGSITRIKLDGGPTIHRLPASLAGVPLADAMAALVECFDWTGDHGVIPGTLGGVSWRLWRSTLTRPLRLDGPTERGAFYGGRQEAPYPAEYQQVTYWDLGAAYPASMAAEPYPSRLKRVDPSTRLRSEPGIARALVTIQPAPWCPLPVRVAPGVICYGYGRTEGWWTWRELVLAKEAGAIVTVRESWAPMGSADMFGAWWALVQEGRKLPGLAGALVKQITSSLWGHFGLGSEGAAMVRWSDPFGRRRVMVAEARDRKLPHEHAVHIAAETTSRVRERLWREGITQLPDAIYADTDAVMTGRGEPTGVGTGAGQWRAKERMVQVEIKAPQVYRWRCLGCEADHPNWHYTVAGIRDRASAEHVFRRRFGPRTAIASMTPGDVSLPAMPLEEAAQYLGGGLQPATNGAETNGIGLPK